MTRSALAAIGLVSISLLLVGCSSDTSSGSGSVTSSQISHLAEEARDAGYVAQADILDDGEVTAAEYDSAIDSYVECAKSFGYTVTDRVISPVDNLTYVYATDTSQFNQDEARLNIDKCTNESLLYVVPSYAGSHKAVMDPPMVRALSSCLKDGGIEPSGDETKASDFGKIDDMDYEVFSRCISKVGDELYPELPALNVAF